MPITNGEYIIVKGEGYVDIPSISKKEKIYRSNLKFSLDTSVVGNSEMQHIDYAFATSLIRTFLSDSTLVLTIRGRKYTPAFSFKVGDFDINVKSVQTEVDAGYEGENQIVLIEAKNSSSNNLIIRQLFYPYRQWNQYSKKEIKTVFFEKKENYYCFWLYEFIDKLDYNSINLVKVEKFEII